MEQIINQDDLKKAIQQLIVEEPEYFKNIIKEIVKENLQNPTDASERQQRIEKKIDEHFDRFDDVFKSLA